MKGNSYYEIQEALSILKNFQTKASLKIGKHQYELHDVLQVLRRSPDKKTVSDTFPLKPDDSFNQLNRSSFQDNHKTETVADFFHRIIK